MSKKTSGHRVQSRLKGYLAHSADDGHDRSRRPHNAGPAKKTASPAETAPMGYRTVAPDGKTIVVRRIARPNDTPAASVAITSPQ